MVAMIGAYTEEEVEEEEDEESWRAWKSQIRSELPYNPQLRAANVGEFDVCLDVVRECCRMYETHVQSVLEERFDTAGSVDTLHANHNRCHKWSSGEFSFFVSCYVLVIYQLTPSIVGPVPKAVRVAIRD